MDVFDLAAKLTLDSSEFENGLKGAAGVAGKIGAGIVSATGAVVTAAASEIKGFVNGSIDAGTEFEKAMSNVMATMGATTEDLHDPTSQAVQDYEILSEFAQKMGAETKFSATQAADALNYMALAGYNTETSLEMLPKVLNLAASGDMELAQASDMVTDASSALGLSIEDTGVLVDKMARTASKSNTSVAQLGEAILTVGGTAKTLSGGTTELSEALGILADNGIKGAEGGTALRNIILTLSAPTTKAKNALRALGVETYDVNGNMRALDDIFADMNTALSTLTQGEKTQVLNDIFNKVDLKSANALLATTTDRWDELTAAIDDSAGAAEAMAEVQLDNLQGDIDIFNSAMEGLQITLSKKLIPSFRKLRSFGADALTKLNKGLKEGDWEGFAEALGEVAGEGINNLMAAVPEFLTAGTKFIGAMIDGIGAALPQLLVDLTGGLADILTEIDNNLTVSGDEEGENFLGALGDSILANLDTIVSAAISIGGKLLEGLAQSLPDIFEGGVSLLTTIIDGISKNLPRLLSSGFKIVSQLMTSLATNAPKLIHSAAEFFIQLARGIGQNLPKLIPQAIRMVSTLVKDIIAEAPRVIDAAIELLDTLGLELTKEENMKTMASDIGSMVGKVASLIITVAPKLVAAGAKMLWYLAKGLLTGIPELLKSLVNELSDGFVKLFEAGDDVTKWLNNKTSEFLKDFEIAWGINSPSKKMEEMGKYLAEGLEIGWDNGYNSVKDSVLEDLALNPKPIHLGVEADAARLANSAGFKPVDVSGYKPINEQGDIVIPVYIGTDNVQTIVVNAMDIANYRAGGR